MKILKVDLHITGTIEIDDSDATTREKDQQEISFNPETDRVAGSMTGFMAKKDGYTCKLEDCQKPAKVRGFCNKHYQKWYQTRKRVSA